MVRFERPLLIFCAAGLAGLIVWWTSLTYATWSTHRLAEQISTLNAEHHQSSAKHQRPETGTPVDVESRLAVAQTEAVTPPQIPLKPVVAIPDGVTALIKRIERTEVSDTSSIRNGDGRKRLGR